MRLIKTLVILSVGTVAIALHACATTSAITAGSGGSSGTGNGKGVGDASGSTSSGGAADGDGAASSSGAGGSGSGGAGDDDAAGDDGSDPIGVAGNCPDTCPGARENCCLVNMGATVWGICVTQKACLARGGGFIECGSPDDCGGADSATPACCLMGAGAGAFPSTVCTTSCPAGSSPACNVDQASCPNGGAGFHCTQVSASIPLDAIGTCTPSVPGAGDSGSSD
jgi:hypothetical protein